MNIVHRDVKPSNVLVCHDPQNPGRLIVKLADFEHSVIGARRWDGFQGTQGYMAPECVSKNSPGLPLFTQASDMWAVGIIVMEVMLYLEFGGIQELALRKARIIDNVRGRAYEESRSEIISKMVAHKWE